MRIGVTTVVNNIETDRSKEANAINLMFDDERDFVLRAFPWPFTTTYATLGLVGGSSSARVSNDWHYSYRYPSDCMFARRLVTGLGRRDPAPPPFIIGRDTQGKLIYTNEPDAELEYTGAVTEPEDFDALCVSALAWKIAAACAPSMSRIKGMFEQCMEGYHVELSMAQAVALNEQQQEEERESDMISSRA